MSNLYDTLKIEYGKCPPDCRLCEEACRKAKYGDSKGISRIKVTHNQQIDFHLRHRMNAGRQIAVFIFHSTDVIHHPAPRTGRPEEIESSMHRTKND